jgi:hypothetical protein
LFSYKRRGVVAKRPGTDGKEKRKRKREKERKRKRRVGERTKMAEKEEGKEKNGKGGKAYLNSICAPLLRALSASRQAAGGLSIFQQQFSLR